MTGDIEQKPEWGSSELWYLGRNIPLLQCFEARGHLAYRHYSQEDDEAGMEEGLESERRDTWQAMWSLCPQSLFCFFPRTLGSCKISLLPSKEDFLVLIEQIWMEFGSLKQKILLWKHIFKFFFSFYCPVIWSQSFCDPVTLRYDIHKCFSALFCFVFPSG